MSSELPDGPVERLGDNPDPQTPPKDDPMGPPTEPCECFCLHCHRTFMSDKMWFQRVIGARDGFEGFWMCPTNNCGGAGFTFDIFPTDPNHPANAGWHSSDGPDEEGGEWDEEMEASDDPEAEWDPDEPHFKAMDEECEEDGDIEGEEWKFGAEPAGPPEMAEDGGPPIGSAARKHWEEEEAKYNSPDLRPREIQYTEEEPLPRSPPGTFSDDDIPF